ncbi:MAG TPA: GNAT family protein [Candidatus Acidoferrales bacterium]|nr:GNAT family protein [Candidatus Acidoferrales bacterium]
MHEMIATFIQGNVVCLRSLGRADLALLAEWLNDSEVTRLLFMGLLPTNVEMLAAQWERDRNNPDEIAFAVCDGKTGAFVGTTGLYRIHWVMRTAEFRVFIGDKRVWNRGIGTECAKLMVVYGFEKLNLNKVWLGVNAENPGGVRAYEKAGFVHEGVLRQEQYRNFRYYDAIRMSLLRSEYEALRETYLQPRAMTVTK